MAKPATAPADAPELLERAGELKALTEALEANLPYGDARIDGDGVSTAWGTFNAIPLS